MNISIQTDPTKNHTAPSGRQYRVVMVEQLTSVPQKYINGSYRSNWRTLYEYADDNSRLYIYWGYNDEFLKSEKF